MLYDLSVSHNLDEEMYYHAFKLWETDENLSHITYLKIVLI